MCVCVEPVREIYKVVGKSWTRVLFMIQQHQQSRFWRRRRRRKTLWTKIGMYKTATTLKWEGLERIDDAIYCRKSLKIFLKKDSNFFALQHFQFKKKNHTWWMMIVFQQNINFQFKLFPFLLRKKKKNFDKKKSPVVQWEWELNTKGEKWVCWTLNDELPCEKKKKTFRNGKNVFGRGLRKIEKPRKFEEEGEKKSCSSPGRRRYTHYIIIQK
jgi:hypothetical protein